MTIAARLGHPAVQPEHLLVGLLRLGDLPLHLLVQVGRVEPDRVACALPGRLRPSGDRTEGPLPPRHPHAEAAVEAAIAFATVRCHEEVHPGHLRAVLLPDTSNRAVQSLAESGVDLSAVLEALLRTL